MFVSMGDVAAIKRDPRGQGDRGEVLAAMWFAERGATVFTPFFHTSPHVDFMVERNGTVWRVQVKTSAFFRLKRWDVTLCTRGGNQSWSGMVKHLDPGRYDRLFVVVGDGRRWLIPSDEVGGSTGIRLGGPKYARFEIEPGPPLILPADR
jgi:hypothetical protein